MTAPVTVVPDAPSQKIAMTAPVTIAPADLAASPMAGNRWRVHFVMPGAYTLATLPKPTGSILEIATGVAKNSRTAFAMQYGSIFFITTIVCLVGAVFALFIGGRQSHADEGSDMAAPSSSGARLPG
jgi:hypothetical protein